MTRFTGDAAAADGPMAGREFWSPEHPIDWSWNDHPSRPGDAPLPVEPDGGSGGAPLPVEPDGGIGDGPLPVEPDGGIGDGPFPTEPGGGIGGPIKVPLRQDPDDQPTPDPSDGPFPTEPGPGGPLVHVPIRGTEPVADLDFGSGGVHVTKPAAVDHAPSDPAPSDGLDLPDHLAGLEPISDPIIEDYAAVRDGYDSDWTDVDVNI